jgi:hypothetical protein
MRNCTGATQMKVSLARFVGIVLGLGLCFSPIPAFALITLPFSTTYDCAEQRQFDGTWVTCQGLGNNGDWTTKNGSKEQITSAANYPLGGGGRGQRHWIGNSIDNTNGSGSISYSWNGRVQEIYVRWYTRWEAGIKLNTEQGQIRKQKIIYFNGAGCGSAVAGCVFDVEGSGWSFTMAGTSLKQSLNGNTGWDGLFGGGNNAPSDGRWIRIEIHLKNETSGSANDGRARLWVDGALAFDWQNIDFKGSDGFDHFSLPSNHGFITVGSPPRDMYQDFDDVAVRTTGPIGPIGGTSLPPPANLNVR